jgi:F-box domain
MAQPAPPPRLLRLSDGTLYPVFPSAPTAILAQPATSPLMLELPDGQLRPVFSPGHHRTCLDQPDSFLLNIPFEMLRHICSFVLNSEFDFEWECNISILNVRQVCRLLRRAVDTLQFWHKAEFQIHLLIAQPRHDRWIARIDYEQQLQFFRALLEDGHLANQLGNKKAWQFRNSSEFLVAFELVASFQHNVEGIRFVHEQVTPLTSMVSLESPRMNHRLFKILAHCTNLKVLFLSHMIPLDFSDLGRFCPGLESLNIHNCRCRTYSPLCLGKLHGLRNLRRLHIYEPGMFIGDLSVPFLPLSSVQSLTRLYIAIERVADLEYCAGSLGSFVNLTSLTFEYLTEKIIDNIIQAAFNLVSFSAQIDTEKLRNKLGELVSAPSLQHVETLYLFFPLSFGESLCSRAQYLPIIAAITRLRWLQRLSLDGLMLDIRWCEMFSQLENLDELNWVTFVVVDSYQLDDGRKEVKRAFRAAFADFIKMPRLRLEIGRFPAGEGYDTDVQDDESDVEDAGEP